MRGRPSTKECSVCHFRHSVAEMHKTTTQVNSGHSGLGISYNPQKSGSARILSGRKYYRNKTIWICDGCWPTYKKSKMNRRIGKLIIWSLIILSLYALL